MYILIILRNIAKLSILHILIFFYDKNMKKIQIIVNKY